MKLLILTFTILELLTEFPIIQANESEDYYKLLGVPRDANLKEIRKAFKTLAVKMHPDKNQDDKDADAKFVKIARAYETLKDPENRKHYDLHGDSSDSNSNRGKKYYSYSYYRDQFGIYDDDPLIVTLSRADYEVTVLDDSQAWFVNFYSPHCHHCHELAPTWRKLAADLEGVVRFAAVNCEDDWPLCRQLSIESYPTLVYYEKAENLHEGERYQGGRTFEKLKNYVLDRVDSRVVEIGPDDWEHGLRKEQWLLFLCGGEAGANCVEGQTRLKLAVILDGLMSVGVIRDDELCAKISGGDSIVFWQVEHQQDSKNVDENDKSRSFAAVNKIDGSDTSEILNNVLSILPNPETLDEKRFAEIRTQLRQDSVKPWLICFYIGTHTDLNLQLKRLPTLVPTVSLGLVHCGKSSALCQSLHISRYPTWGVLKTGGGAFELHHGRDVLHEITSFARESIKSTNLHALSPADFYHIVTEGSTWFIDWYAPWCPPCRKLMPELRRASQHFESDRVQFGTVDCTLHRNLCSREGITSYPTTALYNGTRIHRFHGVPSEWGIVEFVQDMMQPAVISLDDSSFVQLMRKPKEEMWMVDFYAPWCGPCQKLGTEWRKLAKQLLDFPEIKIAQVDCVENVDLCAAQNIKGYPTIRLYPLGSKGLNTVAIFNGNRDVTSLKRWVLGFLPSPVVAMKKSDFEEQISTRKFAIPWLVDFYAPWCGHCTHFEPEFLKIANRLEGVIRTAKVDCEAERMFCGSLRVHSYPTLRLYLSPTEHVEVDSRDVGSVVKRVRDLVKDRGLRHDEL